MDNMKTERLTRTGNNQPVNTFERLYWSQNDKKLVVDMGGFKYDILSFPEDFKPISNTHDLSTYILIYELMRAGEYPTPEKEAEAFAKIWELYQSDSGKKVAVEILSGLAEKALENRLLNKT